MPSRGSAPPRQGGRREGSWLASTAAACPQVDPCRLHCLWCWSVVRRRQGGEDPHFKEPTPRRLAPPPCHAVRHAPRHVLLPALLISVLLQLALLDERPRVRHELRRRRRPACRRKARSPAPPCQPPPASRSVVDADAATVPSTCSAQHLQGPAPSTVAPSSSFWED